MALTRIRGNSQIVAATVTETELASSILATNSGLTGLSGSKLAVGAGTGISVSGGSVSINTASTVTFSGASWTFPADQLLITGTPSVANAAVNRSFVENFVYGLAPKGEVAAVATTDVASLSGTTTIDGVALAISDRVLLAGQTDPIENGIWVVQSGAWTRPVDYATGTDASQAYVYTGNGGTVHANEEWICTSTPGAATIGTDGVTFILFANSGATSYTQGTGISISSGIISLVTPVAVANGGTGVTTFGGTNTILYTTAADTLASITTANNGVLITSGAGAPSISSTLPSAVQGNITGTGTLTSGATGAGFTISFTASTVSGTLTVANGGTGATTLASNGILYGNTTGAIQATASAANSVLVTSAGSIPSLSATLPSAVQGNITGTGTLTSGATGAGFTLALTTSTVTGTLTVANGGTGVSTLVSNQMLVGNGTGTVKTLFKGSATAGANSSAITITGLTAGGTVYSVYRGGNLEISGIANYVATANTLTNTTDPFIIGEEILVEQIQ